MKSLSCRSFFIPMVFMLLVGCVPAATGEANRQSSKSSSIMSYPGLPTQTLTPIASPTVSETALATRTFTPTTALTVSIAALPTPTSTPMSSPIISYPGPPTQTFSPTASPTGTETAKPTETPERTQCPVPTPEPFSVVPVTSPTDQLSQIITVYIGRGEYVTVISESGTFTVTANSHIVQVEISLLPNTVHHLEVYGQVGKVTNYDGCIYGGYTMSTTFDGQGNPLTIVQEMPNSYP